MKFKKGFYLLFVVVFSCIVLAACGEEEGGSAEMETYEYDNSGDVTIENESLELSVSGASTQVQITDKKTGKVYRSNPTAGDVAKYAKATGQFKDILSATLGLTYSNTTNTEKEIDNYSSSIVNGNYSIEKVSENEVKINYSIGDFEKTYVCPIAIKKSRMEQYLSKMTSAAQSSIGRYYKLYDYEELSKSDDEDAENTLMLAQELFPDLQEEPIYYLSEDITDTRLQTCETYFKGAGYTLEDRIADMGTYKVSRNEGKPVFDISVHYILDGDNLLVKVPMNEISYNKDYPLVRLHVLPYMCAANTDEEGYIMVPEGTGGLINFNNGKVGQQTYQSDVYGWDYGVNRTMIIDETDSTFPVVAISNRTKKSSMICVAEEGSAYATVKADISGKNNGYNYGSFVYAMVHGENYDVSSKADTTVRVYEEGLPDENLTQRYIFTDENDYDKLAIRYREYLMKRYPELVKKEKSDVPMAAELIGAVDDTEHILGYPVNREQSLTSYEQAKEILGWLKENGISNLSAKYTGWFNGGIKQVSAAKVKTVSVLGSKSDLKDLGEYAEQTEGLDLFLNATFNYIYKDKFFDGFGKNKNAAKFCNREYAKLYTLDPITYMADGKYKGYQNYDSYYLVKPAYALENLTSYAEKIKDFGVNNIGLEEIGNRLYADYNPKDRVSREKAMTLQTEKMKELKSGGSKLMITGGNQYAVPYADYVTDLDINRRNVNIVDECVPFYQIALHGLVNYSSSAMNLSEDQEENYLKSAETGAGLYYSFFYEKTDVLQDGRYTRFYACNFDEWKDNAVSQYNTYKEKMGDIYNQFITGHEKVAPGVYKTEYENGRVVLVNYNYKDYDYNGTNVPKRDFVTIGGEK